MDEFDALTERLRELGARAPVPGGDPLADIRRGRTALRRRHARRIGGVTTALVAVGAAAAIVPTPAWPGGSEESGSGPAVGASDDATPTPTPTPTPAPTSAARNKCLALPAYPTSDKTTQDGGGLGPSLGMLQADDPGTKAALRSYRQAAAAILDPAGRHIDPLDSERSDNIQLSTACDPRTGQHLTALGTKIGWTSGGALGVVELSVVSPDKDDPGRAYVNHTGWTDYPGRLPAGVVRARVTDYVEGGGGHAVVATRTDGLEVGVDAAGVWGNNVAPGSPVATSLPSVEDLLALAASPFLVLPAD